MTRVGWSVVSKSPSVFLYKMCDNEERDNRMKPTDTEQSSSGDFFVYIVRCADGTLYTGWTTNLTKRMAAHNGTGKGAKYTKTRRPVTIVYAERLKTKRDAMRREYQIKQLSRREKLMLIGWKEGSF